MDFLDFRDGAHWNRNYTSNLNCVYFICSNEPMFSASSAVSATSGPVKSPICFVGLFEKHN